MAQIISAFPGTGKSHYTKTHGSRGGVWDSDSSKFSWLTDENGQKVTDEKGDAIRHPDWPNNYIDHIRAGMSAAAIIFVSSHAEVRDALKQAGLPFTLVYPRRDLREEYLERYSQRGSPPGFVSLIGGKWNEFLAQLEDEQGPNIKHVKLETGQFIEHILSPDFREQ